MNFENTIQQKDIDEENPILLEAQEANKLFKDNIAPEITYKYADTTINQDTQELILVFDVADKYIVDNVNLDVNKIGIIVEGIQVDTTGKLELTYLNDLSTEINGITRKTGERYKLVVKNLDEAINDKNADYNNYSGPVTITFDDGCVIDKSNNPSIGETMTIKIGVDNPGEDKEGVIVDLVRPAWEYVTSSITRTRNNDDEILTPAIKPCLKS